MISVAIAGRIATITLNRPPVNAISNEWLEQFHAHLDALAQLADWHVLHIRSELKVFCAGADLDQIRDRIGAADGPDRMLAYAAGIQRLYARIDALPQVTLAEINGAAMGGGLELALACDLRVVANEAKVGLPEVRLGLLPGAGGTQRLSRVCGRALATRLILCAEVLDGATAAALGLAHWAAPRSELAARAAAIAQQVAALPPAALAASKNCLAAAAEPGRGGYFDELEHTRQLLTNPETRRRVEAFLAGTLEQTATEHKEKGHEA
jgi:enoyl-CoA hydratase/carnithine racemase